MTRAAAAVAAALAAAVVLLAPARAEAYAWMIRHGYGACATCHADPGGGEALTPYGRAQSDLLLRMRYGAAGGAYDARATATEGDDEGDDEDDEEADEAAGSAPAADVAEPSESMGFLWGLVEPPDWMLLGGSARLATLYEPEGGDVRSFPMQMDVYGQLSFGRFRAGGSIGAARVKAGSPHARAAQVTTNPAGELSLISRTHWLGFDVTDEVLVRAGRLNLPFGVRMPEHTMWVREATRTDRESDQQHGVAVAYSGETLRGEVMGIAGNYQVSPDDFRERGYSAFAELLLADWIAAGASSTLAHAQRDRINAEPDALRQAHGLFARLTPTPKVAVFFEGDALLYNYRDPGYAGMLQAWLELVQGLQVGVTGEIFDGGFDREAGGARGAPDRTQAAGLPAFGGWATVEWFFLPHMDLRVDAIVRQTQGSQIMSQLHVFL